MGGGQHLTADPLERLVAWRRLDVDDGLGIVRLTEADAGFAADGWELVFHRGRNWAVHFRVDLDDAWRTRRFEAETVALPRSRRILLEGDGEGHWLIRGRRARRLDGNVSV